MPNRFLTKDEWPAAFAEQARVWREQWRAAENPPDAGMYYTYEAYMALLERYAALKGACHHCWHAPRDWQQGTLQVPVPRLCCWCGSNEGPQHGPYAPKG